MSQLDCQIQYLKAELAVLQAQAEMIESSRRRSGELYQHILDVKVATQFCIQPIDAQTDWPRPKFEVTTSSELRKLLLGPLEAEKKELDLALEPEPLNIL